MTVPEVYCTMYYIISIITLPEKNFGSMASSDFSSVDVSTEAYL